MQKIEVPKDLDIHLLLGEIKALQQAIGSTIYLTLEESNDSTKCKLGFKSSGGDDGEKTEIVQKKLSELERISVSNRQRDLRSFHLMVTEAESLRLDAASLKKIGDETEATLKWEEDTGDLHVLNVFGTLQQFNDVELLLRRQSAEHSMRELHKSLDNTYEPVPHWAKKASECQSLAMIDLAFKRQKIIAKGPPESDDETLTLAPGSSSMPQKPAKEKPQVLYSYNQILDSMIEERTESLKLVEPHFVGETINEVTAFCKFSMKRALNIQLSLLVGSVFMTDLADFNKDLEDIQQKISARQAGANPRFQIRFINDHSLHDRFLISKSPSGKATANLGRGFYAIKKAEGGERWIEEHITRVNVVKRGRDENNDYSFDSLFEAMWNRSAVYPEIGKGDAKKKKGK